MESHVERLNYKRILAKLKKKLNVQIKEALVDITSEEKMGINKQLSLKFF